MRRWICVLTLTLLFEAAGAQDWPLWRGNSSNSGFENSGPKLPLRQQAAIGSLKIEENGMIVADDMVYITTSDGRLHAYTLNDGQPVAGFPVQVAEGKNYSSPAYSDDKVFVRHGASGNLYAFHALTGSLVWGPIPAGGTQNPRFCGPVIADGKIYVGGGDGYLYAFQVRDGQTVSGFPVAVGADDYGASPAVADGIVYYNSSEGKIFAFNAANGEPVPGYPIELVSSAFKKAPVADDRLQMALGLNASSLTAADGKIYVFAGDDKLYAFNAKNGSAVPGFPATTGGSNIGYYGSPAAAEGVIYIFCQDGQLYAYDGSDGHVMKGFPVSLNPEGSRNFSSPTVGNGMVFIGAGDTKTYYAIAAARTELAGRILWSQKLASDSDNGFSLCSPVLAGDRLLITLNSGRVHILGNNPNWTGGSVLINDGDVQSPRQLVTLTLDPGSNLVVAIDSMIISNNPLFIGSNWEGLTETKEWMLAAAGDTESVYVRFKDVDENLSPIFYDDIIIGDPPGSAFGLTATASAFNQIQLSWNNPTDPNWKATRILRRTGGYPANAADGEIVYDGRSAECVDINLEPSTTYYYAAYAYNISDAFAVLSETARATAVTFPAPAKSTWQVTVTNIDATHFPLIKSFVTVIDSTTKTSVSGLSAANFSVTEDKQVEEPISASVVSSGSGANADIVFVFDTTGSLSGEIEGLKARATSFADALAAHGIDYRLGLVTFADEVLITRDFTADLATFKTWIQELSADGGADTKENALEGLARATTLSYRPVSQRIAILITDAPYHQAGETDGDGTTTYTTQTMIDRLREYNLITYAVGPDLVEFHQLANATGGAWFDINGEFMTIIDAISSILSSQYVITYTTHQPDRDNRWRDVVIRAARETLSGSGSSKYYVSNVTEAIASFNPPSKANTWIKYRIPLTAESFGLSALEFASVLSSVKRLRFRLETSDSKDTAGLDSVRIGGIHFSGFGSGTENWSASGDGTMYWQNSGGVQGGYLQISDWGTGDYFYATAPAEWSGDWRPLIGQEISFYFKTSHPDYAGKVEITTTAGKRLLLSVLPIRLSGGSIAEIRVALSEPATVNTPVLLTSSTSGCFSVPSPIVISRNSTSASATFAVPSLSSACTTVITATSEGCEPTRLSVDVDPNLGEDKAVLSGQVTDATNGAGIAGATVTVAGASTVTDGAGYYRIENIDAAALTANFNATPRSGVLPLNVQFTDLSTIGHHTVSVTAIGYYRYESIVRFNPSETKNLDFSLSPEMSAGEMRLVLNWGNQPLDLDLHVLTPAIEGSQYEVYWNTVGSKSYAPYVYLDHDDQDGFGPETITIAKSFSGLYRIFVENYSTSPALTGSNGVVQIYGASGLLQTIPVPSRGEGTYWYIGDLDGSTGAITVKNVVQHYSPAGSLAKRPTKSNAPMSESIATAITSWAWDFDNDGTVDDTQQNPTHLYTKPGSYYVTLRVSDGSKSASTTKEKFIAVQPNVETDVAWVKQISATSNHLYAVHAIDTMHAWVAGDKGTVLKTDNGGDSWTAVNTYTQFNLKSLFFINTTTGWAVGMDAKKNAVILKTSNSGLSWTNWPGTSTSGLLANHMTSGLSGWNVGESGKIEKTADGGAAWSSQASGLTTTLRSVFFINAETGWTVGDNGVILKTTNAGFSWSTQSSGVSTSLTGVFFINSAIGWVVTDDGKVLYTENGGVNWTGKQVAEVSLRDVHFVNEFHGYVVGDAGVIYKTYDAGETWIKDHSLTTAALHGLHLMAADCGWAVGDNGAILRLRRGAAVPSAVLALTARATGTSSIALSWSNPSDAYYARTVILRKEGGYPGNPEDGVMIYSGTAESTVDAGLKSKTIYYYTAFACNPSGQYGAPGETSRTSASTLEGLNLYGWKTTVSSIDVASFPTVKSFVSVVDSATHTPVTGLTAAHFRAREDGVLESPLTVEMVSSSSGAKADIVFVFDVTGSMGGEINDLKARASAFADALAARGIDYRLGLVSYGDEIRDSKDFTMDIATFKSWIEGLTATGGSDVKENSLEGLGEATKLSFRSVSQRIAILITDADYHEAGESGDGTTSYTTESMIKLLNDHRIVTNVVGPDLSKMRQLAEGAGGLWFSIDDDFQRIIDRLGSILSSQYVVSYTTHHPVRDNTWRDVLIIAQKENKGGYDSTRYYIAGELGRIHNFSAVTIGYDKIYCHWTNPSVKNYAGIRVFRKAGGYPIGAIDGTLVYDGTADGFTDKGLSSETAYFYRAFTYDIHGVLSEASESAQAFSKTWAVWTTTSGWSTVKSSVTNNLYAVHAVDSARVWVMGQAGAQLRSNDGGNTWESKFVPAEYTLYALQMLNSTVGWAVGQNKDGALNLKTASSGQSWTAWPSSSSRPLYDNSMVSALMGWQVGAYGHIEKTVDGGATWTAQFTNADKTFYGVDFVDGLIGWVVGTQGTILKTKDSGIHWTAQASNTSATLNDLCFVDELTGWIVCSDGKVLSTIDGGTTWTSKAVADVSLNGVSFSDVRHGWVVGNNGTVYSTADGGASWGKQVSGVTTHLNAVHMISALQGWIVGDQGVILKLTGNSSAPAELTGLQVSCTSVDAEAFPVIKCFVTVVDATSRAVVAGLSKDHFTVKEDGVIESPITVESMSAASGAKADIVFVFDVTGSMGDEITGLKQRAFAFADALLSKGVDYRLGLVTFGDAVDQVHDFTGDVTEFKAWIEGLRASGGGDTKENALEGLAQATKLSYRNLAQKIVVLITDAPYHQAGETGGGTTTYTTDSLIALLQDLRIVTHVVAPDQPSFHLLAEKTGGLWFNITGDFAAIVDSLGVILSSQYVITYTTHQPVPGDGWRNVLITALKEGKGGYDTGRYYMGSARLALSPDLIMGKAGIVFTVRVEAVALTNVGLCHVVVAYDPTKMRYTDFTAGDYLAQNGAATPLFTVTPDSVAGRVDIAATRIGGATGANGDGVLCSLDFLVKIDNCASEITLPTADLRTPDNVSIPVDTSRTIIKAAKTAALLGDLDADKDIDLKDFVLLTNAWQPKNDSKGDIGPAIGTVPLLTAVKDGLVNFEDLFVFTRMWNWYQTNVESAAGSALGKTNPVLQWRVGRPDVTGTSIVTELRTAEVRRLAMGHLALRYDPAALSVTAIHAGSLLESEGAVPAFLSEQDQGKGLIDIAFSRLVEKGDPEIHEDGVLLQIEWKLLDAAASAKITLAGADLRSADNSRLAVEFTRELELSAFMLPTQFALLQNYPNPFNNHTEITFLLPVETRIKLQVVNILGQPVITLCDRLYSAGSHRLIWDGKNELGRDVVSGVYILRMQTHDYTADKIMTYVK